MPRIAYELGYSVYVSGGLAESGTVEKHSRTRGLPDPKESQYTASQTYENKLTMTMYSLG